MIIGSVAYMIIRKPYAFLIKNFKKIHILLLILSLFVAYKLVDVSNYVNEFVRLGTYDYFGDPITKHITFWLNLSLWLMAIGSIALLLLLRYKKKPWKIYLVPIVQCIALVFVLSMIKSFFNGYSTGVETTDVRLARDLLMIFGFAQIISIGIFVMRVFGLDIKKFQFNSDQEFLELSEADREEIEIEFNFDKHSIIRGVKRLFRNLRYIYLEHKMVCLGIVGIIVIGSAFSIARFFLVTNKSYSEGDLYSINGYTFEIKNAYFTDKDFNGNVIEAKSNFVIIDLSVINHAEARSIYFENFHVRNGTDDYVTTNKTYAHEFEDLGVPYESVKKIKRDEELRFIIIYKVANDLKKDRFVLYYQEKDGNLRKIKLKVKDISHIDDIEEKTLGDEIPLTNKYKDEVLRMDLSEIVDTADYTIKRCGVSTCDFDRRELTPPEGYKILKIQFSSDAYEAKNMIDFLRNYGKLNYRDSEDEVYDIDIVNLVSEGYNGKTAFLKVPNDVMNAKEIYFDIIIRNKHYKYTVLLGGDTNEEGNG